MNKNVGIKGSNVLSSILIGCLIGFLVAVLLLVLFAVIISAAELGTAFARVASVIILAVSSLIVGAVTAKRSPQRKLLSGVASGALFYLIIGVVSMVVTKNAFSASFLIRMLICVAAASIGSTIVTLKQSSKKYI